MSLYSRGIPAFKSVVLTADIRIQWYFSHGFWLCNQGDSSGRRSANFEDIVASINAAVEMTKEPEAMTVEGVVALLSTESNTSSGLKASVRLSAYKVKLAVYNRWYNT